MSMSGSAIPLWNSSNSNCSIGGTAMRRRFASTHDPAESPPRQSGKGDKRPTFPDPLRTLVVAPSHGVASRDTTCRYTHRATLD